MRRCQRRDDLLAEIVGRGELVTIAEDRPEALGDYAHFGQAPGQAMGNLELLQLVVEPVGDILVLVAVAQEGEIAVAEARDTPHGRPFVIGRAIIGRQSGKLRHRRPRSTSR